MRQHTSEGSAAADIGLGFSMDSQGTIDAGTAAERGVTAVTDTVQRLRAASALASAQHGVIARRQLRELAFPAGTIDGWVRTGRLHVIHRGVYLLGHRAEHARAREMAAVIACGPSAVISHQSAAFLWRLLRLVERPTPIEVTVSGRTPGRKPGLRIHRANGLPPADCRSLGPIAITTPARTVLDLARCGPSRLVEEALAEAMVRRLVTERSMRTLIDRERPRAGTGLLRRLLGEGPKLTKSEAEARLLHVVRGGGLPEPETNVVVGRFRVDALWRDEALVLEVDGFRFHGGRQAFERDRARDAALAAMGYQVIRVTWRQLVDEPSTVLVRVAQALVMHSR